jgi:hypothetical protein
MATNQWISRATKKAARRHQTDRWHRPKDWFEYQDWDDDWRSRIMDQLAKIADGSDLSFAAGAQILLVGWQVGYDG